MALSAEGVGFDSGQLPPVESLRTGFGLVSIHGRLDLMGNTMDMDSTPGKGRELTSAVPEAGMISAPKRAEVGPAARQASTQVRPPQATMIRVLLVDDHAIIRDGLERLMNDEGDIEVVGHAADGLAAITQARTLEPDVVLMDVNLPELNGIDATRIVTSELPRVRVIGLTMHEEDETTRAMVAAGAVACLSKRESAATILATVRAHGPKSRIS
jgi:CheY-like chemotaxis protein